MKTLHLLIKQIQDIISEFDGTVSIKNSNRKYFYVSEPWLKAMKLKRSEVIGKTDEQIASKENAEFIRKSDEEARVKKKPIYYKNKVLLHGKEVTYYAIKWVTFHPTGEVFCYCKIGHQHDDKKIIATLQKKIAAILNTKHIELADHTTA